MSPVPKFIKNTLFPRHSRFGRFLRRIREARRSTPDSPPPDFSPRTDEFNLRAESYWQAVAFDPSARAGILGKPFTTTAEASSILYRSGLVLEELRLGPGMSVLDVGAGSGWLSSWLSRLNVRTISLDISPTALELARELFRKDPPARPELVPQTIVYNGRRFPLAEESVDRIVCFDAFHHVPNGTEILAEIFRVLKNGGRAVFAEPGEGHFQAAHSRIETERFRVLENELNLPALAETAKNLGFSEFLVKPFPDPGAVTLDFREYREFMNGKDRFFPLDEFRKSLRDFYVFILVKGKETFDSRNPRRLTAEIATSSESREIEGKPGAAARMTVDIRNTGDTLWLVEPQEFGGYVRLGGHLLDPDGQIRNWDFLRVFLSAAVPPGGSLACPVDFHFPDRPGRYLLRLDLVDENIAWFSQRGSGTTDVRLCVTAAESPKNG